MEELTKLDFHFRLSEEFGLATNSETGEKAELHLTVSFPTSETISEEKMSELRDELRLDMVEKWQCDDSWITAITKEEYEAQSCNKEVEVEVKSE